MNGNKMAKVATKSLGSTRSLGQALRAHPFMAGLSERLIESVESCARRREFQLGEYLEKQGRMAQDFFLVAEGEVGLELSVPHQGAIRVGTVSEGEVLGWSWLIGPYRPRFDARALEPIQAIALNAERLREMCELDHDLGYEIMFRFAGVIGRRLDATRLKLLELLDDDKS